MCRAVIVPGGADPEPDPLEEIAVVSRDVCAGFSNHVTEAAMAEVLEQVAAELRRAPDADRP